MRSNRSAPGERGEPDRARPLGIGVVFGDIGTSPFYTLKTALRLAGGTPDAAAILGVLSLVVWTLIVITTIKYVSVAMRVDNDGEGGILALMPLLGVKRRHHPTIVAVGLFGAALNLRRRGNQAGDFGALGVGGAGNRGSGLRILCSPGLGSDPCGAFAIQPQGTSRIAQAFGPIMALWSTRPTSRSEASGATCTVPLIGRAGQSTFG